MLSLRAVQGGARRAVETPICLVAVGVASVFQLVYEKYRPESLPAVADWVVTAAILAGFLAFVLSAVAPSVPLRRAASAYALALIFLVAKAGFLSFAAPAVPVFFASLAAAFALGGAGRVKTAWPLALCLGGLYALTALCFSLFMRLLPGGAAALPATAFFAFMGLFAAAAPAALEDR